MAEKTSPSFIKKKRKKKVPRIRILNAIQKLIQFIALSKSLARFKDLLAVDVVANVVIVVVPFERDIPDGVFVVVVGRVRLVDGVD